MNLLVCKKQFTGDRGIDFHVGKLVSYAFHCFPEAHDAAKCKPSKPI